MELLAVTRTAAASAFIVFKRVSLACLESSSQDERLSMIRSGICSFRSADLVRVTLLISAKGPLDSRRSTGAAMDSRRSTGTRAELCILCGVFPAKGGRLTLSELCNAFMASKPASLVLGGGQSCREIKPPSDAAGRGRTDGMDPIDRREEFAKW